MSTPTLMIVVASTRPGRVGRTVADWFIHIADEFDGFEIDVVDLAELNLPFVDEPNHPRLHNYTKQHTKEWSARVEAADAFVFVMPEYNHGFTAPLKNALDFLFQEWAYKPVGFVSYGGISGGTRAVQLLKPIVSALKLYPVVDIVNIAWVNKFIQDGVFQGDEAQYGAAQMMLKELENMSAALKTVREAQYAAV